MILVHLLRPKMSKIIKRGKNQIISSQKQTVIREIRVQKETLEKNQNGLNLGLKIKITCPSLAVPYLGTARLG
jgi:hypothetical protein